MQVAPLIVLGLTRFAHQATMPRISPHTSLIPRMAVAATPDAKQAAEPAWTKLEPRHLKAYAQGELLPARFENRYALAGATERVSLGRAAVWDRARVGFYFSLWYALSVIYSVKNKQAHIALALPNAIATAQLLVGAAVAAVMWLARLRTPPRVSTAAFRALLPIGLLHGIGHLTGVFATAAGSVSFVQVVKSAGPFWACLVSGALLGEVVSRRVWLSLVPIVGGVALASAKELHFVWAAFLASVASDVALALRNVLSKQSMDKTKDASHMTPANTFYLFTCLSCLFCLPITLGLEWQGAAAAWRAAAPSTASALPLLALIAESGLYFTAYSEVQFKALDQISPITHAVGNTMRRVVIMLVCIAVFGTPVTLLGGVGSAIAIGGSYAYAMAKTHEKEKAEAARRKRVEAKEEEEEDGAAGRVDHPLLPLMKVVGRLL